MKTHLLLFVVGTIWILASCGEVDKGAEALGNTDSLAKVKVDSATNVLKAKEEATLLAATKAAEDSISKAIQRADSIEKASQKRDTTKKRPTATKVTATIISAAPAPKAKREEKVENTDNTLAPSKSN